LTQPVSRPGSGPRILQVRREVDACSPAALLSAGQGGARGFWALGDRWIAHAGVVREIAVPGGAEASEQEAGLLAEEAGLPAEDGGRATATNEPCRFQAVQDQAAGIFGGIGGGGRSRVFGGFAFAPRRSGDRMWASFPPALFHLPEVELEHRPVTRKCTLVVRAQSRAEARRKWEVWARRVSGGATQTRPGRRYTRLGAAGTRLAASKLERAIWHRMVSGTLRRIRDGQAEKVVLARTMEVDPPHPVEPLDLVMALWEENHGSHVFLFEPGSGSALVGAAPETIATVVNGVVRSTAVAGSIAVGAHSVETAQLARELYNSEKDRAEHDFVVQDMVARLSALGCTVRRDVAPHVLTLARIQHLETKIAATIPDARTLLDIVASLHPTPAVCGMPRNVARSILTESEVFDRGWYAGPVGWFASDGKGIFVPALRSAVGTGSRWRLFAGGGIVAGSDPALEWEETELKFQPVLRAMARARIAAGAATGSG